MKENNKPVADIMDYKEYLRLKEIAEDRADYYSAAEVKRKERTIGVKPLLLTSFRSELV